MGDTERLECGKPGWASRSLAELLGRVNPSDQTETRVYREAAIRPVGSELIIQNAVTKIITSKTVSFLHFQCIDEHEVVVEIKDDEVSLELNANVTDSREIAPGLFETTATI